MDRLDKLKKEQEKLARKVSLKDAFDEINLIAGCDINYYENTIIVGFVVFRGDDIIEQSNEVREVKFPYKPGFLSYREAPSILEAFYKLQHEPDLIMITRNGVMHPRRFGLASHIGISLDKPVIGVSKKLLYGEVKDGKVYGGDKLIGYVLKVKDQSNPIYVSPGNKVSMKTALEIVKNNFKNHKLPEYLHIAHKYTNKIKKDHRFKT